MSVVVAAVEHDSLIERLRLATCRIDNKVEML